MFGGSYTSTNDPVYKKSEKDFEKNALLGDIRKWKKKKKKINLKEFLKSWKYYHQN